jgi:hypothetical protein
MSFMSQAIICLVFFGGIVVAAIAFVQLDNFREKREAKARHHRASHDKRYTEIGSCPQCEHEVRHKTTARIDACAKCAAEADDRKRSSRVA